MTLEYRRVEVMRQGSPRFKNKVEDTQFMFHFPPTVNITRTPFYRVKNVARNTSIKIFDAEILCSAAILVFLFT